MSFPWLTTVLWLPIVGFVVLLAIPRRAERAIKAISLFFGVTTFGASVPLYLLFGKNTAAMQFVEFHPWIKLLGRYAISYHLGVDGISLFLVLLTTFLTPIAMLASWRGIVERQKEFYLLMLFLETGMLGVFMALDLFLFYIFWEATLIPMYLIIGMWGYENRVYASIKFILYTLAGSLLMLVAIIFLGLQQSGGFTFNLLELLKTPLAPSVQTWLFLAFGLAFAIKVPVFPLHTWLPDAHTEAPTAGSVILAGILLKMGTYGFLRFCLPLFPDASRQFMPLFVALALIGIVYGALVAYVQPDIKKLVAYSSVSHLGFVMLGIFAFNLQAIEGAIVLMVSHGLTTGALFLIVGMLYDRRHTRAMTEYGGVWSAMPVFGGIFLFITLASLGLPGLSGFVGEFLVIQGSFLTRMWLVPSVAAFGVLLAAIYLLWLFQAVMQGKLTRPENQVLPDLTIREGFVLVPVVVAVLAIGVYPRPLLDRMHASVSSVVTRVVSAHPDSTHRAAHALQSALCNERLRTHAPSLGPGERHFREVVNASSD